MFSHDYAKAKEQIIQTVKDLHAQKDKPDVQQRRAQVDEIIEQFYLATGHRPDDRILTRLSDYLLVDILADQYKHQRKDENPIQSNNQIRKRQARHNVANIDDRKDV